MIKKMVAYSLLICMLMFSMPTFAEEVESTPVADEPTDSGYEVLIDLDFDDIELGEDEYLPYFLNQELEERTGACVQQRRVGGNVNYVTDADPTPGAPWAGNPITDANYDPTDTIEIVDGKLKISKSDKTRYHSMVFGLKEGCMTYEQAAAEQGRINSGILMLSADISFDDSEGIPDGTHRFSTVPFIMFSTFDRGHVVGVNNNGGAVYVRAETNYQNRVKWNASGVNHIELYVDFDRNTTWGVVNGVETERDVPAANYASFVALQLESFHSTPGYYIDNLKVIHCDREPIHEFYVSTTGEDSILNGTIDRPYRTINYAISQMQEGDTCYIMGGTYNESVEINFNSDSTTRFVAYEGQKVTIIPSQQITGWAEESDNIWKATMDWNLQGVEENDGERNMVFADDKPCFEARWPNIALDVDQTNGHPLLDTDKYARAAEGTGVTSNTFVFGNDVPEFDDLNGAVIWCSGGHEWASYHHNITAYDSVTRTATTSSALNIYYCPMPNSIYYITHHKNLLDIEGEWYKDVAGKTLYYYTENPDGPQNVTAKSSEYALLFKGARNVEIEGIDFTGGLVEFDADSSYCSIYDSVMETLEYHLSTKNLQGSARGVTIGGSHNLMHGCEVKNMYSEGVNVAGSSNRLLNSYIHDANFEHSGASGIYITGKNCLVSHNTVKKTARSAIGGAFKSSIISYNDFSEANLISKDTGVLYLNNNDYENSEFHHNYFHNSLKNTGFQHGIYLDMGSSSLVFYNNLIYNIEVDNITQSNAGRSSLVVNPYALGNVFLNNTIINNKGITFGDPIQASGGAFVNNLFKNRPANDNWNVEYDVLLENNLHSGDFWTSVDEHDYTLKDGSSAIDAGVFISGVTDDYEGNAPDCGAFEYGAEPWTAGHDFSMDYSNEELELNTDIPYVNVLENGSFEKTDFLEGWDYIGEPEKCVQDMWYFWGKYTISGTNSVELEDGEKIYRTVSGLEPNTRYEFIAHTALGDDKNISSSTQNSIASGTTKTYTVDFKDGEYDKLYLGFANVDKSTSNIEVQLGDGTSLATIEAGQWNILYAKDPFWIPIEINGITGEQTVKVIYTNTANMSLSFLGVHPFCSDSDDSMVIRLTSDSGETVEVEEANEYLSNDKKKIFITTGNEGEINIEIEKVGDLLNGYVDYVTLVKSVPFSKQVDYDIITEDFNYTDMDVYETNDTLDDRFGFGYKMVYSSWDGECNVDGYFGTGTAVGHKFPEWVNSSNTISITDGKLTIKKNDNRDHQLLFTFPRATKRKLVKISFDLKFDNEVLIELLGQSPHEPKTYRDCPAVGLHLGKVNYWESKVSFNGTKESEKTEITTFWKNSDNHYEIIVDLEEKKAYAVVNGTKYGPFTCDINGIEYLRLRIFPNVTTSGTYIDNLTYIPVYSENEDHDLYAINAKIKKVVGDESVEIVKPESGVINSFEAKMLNSSGAGIPMVGILGVYDANGKMTNVVVSDREITTDDDTFGIGTTINQNDALVKLFTWNSDSFDPLLNSYNFKK